MIASKICQTHIVLCLIFVIVFGFVLNQMRSPSKSNGLLPGWPVSGCGLNGPEPLPYQSPPQALSTGLASPLPRLPC